MLNITGQTRIIGVIGYPVSHSRSPQMHNAAIADLGLNFVYLPFNVKPQDLEDAIKGFKAQQLVGVNVTIPHKQVVIPMVDQLSTQADLIGAVNTLIFEEDQIYGHNTDAEGFIQAMEETLNLSQIELPSQDIKVVVLGAGGAARAIIVALALNGATEIIIANRTRARAKHLIRDLGCKFSGLERMSQVQFKFAEINSEELANHISTSHLLVNTTSVGMIASNEIDLFNLDALSVRTVVYDIVYTPPVTALMKAAQIRGCPTIGGIGMLVHQGSIAFQKWTNVVPNVSIMRQALLQSLGNST